MIGRILITSVLVPLLVSPAIRVSTAQSETTPAPVRMQTAVPVTPFGSVELRDGGRAILRHGPTPRVTLLKGSLEYTAVMIADGGRLVIDKCKSRCPRGYDLEMEIVAPAITRISVAHGGTIQTHGNFPRMAEIGVAVSNGGTIDIRSMAVDRVTASVEEGGRILTMPQTAMFARVVNGGRVTYWGDANVKSSVQGGGDVTKGTAAEADKALSEISPSLPAVPPIPPVPTIQPLPNLMR
jgi:Putative auto-transporter adhesin, head GIN domain